MVQQTMLIFYAGRLGTLFLKILIDYHLDEENPVHKPWADVLHIV